MPSGEDTNRSLITAAEEARIRELSPSRMRDLIAAAGITAVSRRPGRGGANLYDADELARVVGPGRGARTDLTAEALAVIVTATRRVAVATGREPDHDKVYARLVDGDASMAPRLVDLARRWVGRRPRPDLVDDVEMARGALDGLNDLPGRLDLRVRHRMLRSVAARCADTDPDSTNPPRHKGPRSDDRLHRDAHQRANSESTEVSNRLGATDEMRRSNGILGQD